MRSRRAPNRRWVRNGGPCSHHAASLRSNRDRTQMGSSQRLLASNDRRNCVRQRHRHAAREDHSIECGDGTTMADVGVTEKSNCLYCLYCDPCLRCLQLSMQHFTFLMRPAAVQRACDYREMARRVLGLVCISGRPCFS